MYLLLFIFLLQIGGVLIEIIFIKFFTKSYVKSGIVVFNEKLPINSRIKFPENDLIIKKRVGDFIISKDKNIYVFPKLFWSGWYNVKTKYSLRFLVSQLDNNLLIIGKISILAIVFDLITVVVILFICYLILSNINITIAIFASSFILFMMFISFIQPYFAIKDNYSSMIKELKNILSKEEFKI